MYKVIKDTVILPEEQGRFVLMNVFAHSCLGVDSDTIEVIGSTLNLSNHEILEHYHNREFKVWEIGWFSYDDGLLADPTRYIRSTDSWPEPLVCNVVELIRRLVSHYFIVDNIEKYYDRFSSKKSLLDYEHFGNFHEQVGQHLLIKRRTDPGNWWVNQKFSDDGMSLRNNLYKAVQEYNLISYFKNRFSSGDLIIDVGCGTGYYAELMADAGAGVIGLDPNQKYIEMAQARSIERTQFEVVNISVPGALDHIPSASADYIFMSDALLFYFVPVGKNQTANMNTLFKDLRRILKPEGRFISVEPHYIFWLLPWLGEVERPFSIVTEYLERSFRVTPGISELIQAFCRGGFAVTWMEEFLPDPAFKEVNPRAYHFAARYPLWQLYELKPL